MYINNNLKIIYNKFSNFIIFIFSTFAPKCLKYNFRVSSIYILILLLVLYYNIYFFIIIIIYIDYYIL